MSNELLALAGECTGKRLAMLRLFQTWTVRKVRGRWVAPSVPKISQVDMNWLHYKGLARLKITSRFDELVITHLGQQLLALKTKAAKPAAVSHQERAA